MAWELQGCSSGHEPFETVVRREQFGLRRARFPGSKAIHMG